MFDPGRCLAVCAAAVCLFTLPAAAEPPGPLGEGAKLCLYPLELPFSEGQAEKRRPALEKKLVDAFGAASFTLADSAAVKALEERVRTDAGGYIEPAFGWRDGPRYLAYRERLAQALRDELGCDGQLFASVVTLRAWFANGVAHWDGTDQQVSSTGRQVMNALAGVEERGWVSAFSLWLHVTDLAGEDVAFRSAGIETPVQFAVVEEKDVVAEDRWLTDEARLDAAIASALGPNGDALRQHGTP
jgi:hypothetical protein